MKTLESNEKLMIDLLNLTEESLEGLNNLISKLEDEMTEKKNHLNKLYLLRKALTGESQPAQKSRSGIDDRNRNIGKKIFDLILVQGPKTINELMTVLNYKRKNIMMALGKRANKELLEVNGDLVSIRRD